VTDNNTLLARRAAAVPRGVGSATPLFAAKAENSEIWDVEGRRYIDFAGGIGVQNVGHRNPRVVAAVRDQLDRYVHTSFQVVQYEPYVELAEKLNALAPFSAPAKTILFTSGAEAVENAVKIARAATGRANVIAFTGGFHGRTFLTSTLTGKVRPYKQRLGPAAAGIYHLPFPNARDGVSVDETLRALKLLFKADVEADSVAAIIIEPVQGEGGFHAAPFELLSALRAVCDQHGILLISDEVQAGFGRTGSMFGIQHSGVEPDLVTIAKSIGGGLPLSGVIGRAEIMDASDPGGLGGTYGGPPLACAAGLAVLEVIKDDDLLARSRRIGERIRERLNAIRARNDYAPIGEIRGLGAMVAFEVLDTPGGKTGPEVVRQLLAEALKSGLIVLSCGADGEAVRILAPLTIQDEVLAEGLDILEAALVAAR
jgi:4-aminobutyrate aminotransferase/(S)-3-amino-2-methylpropionate transaminase